MAFSVRATASAIGLRKHARTFGRIALGLLFVWAGATKLSAPRAFAATISRFDLVPESALPLLAIGLPLIELIAGLGAAAGRRDSFHVILATVWLLPARRQGKETYVPNKKTSDSEDTP